MSDDDDNKNNLDDSVEIMFPERQLKINDQLITMPEITFIQGMRFGVLLKPLIDDLSELFDLNEQQHLSLNDIQFAFENHGIAVIEVLAQLINKEPNYIESLSDTDGQALMLVFWQVNQSFFLNRLMSKKIGAGRQ